MRKLSIETLRLRKTGALTQGEVIDLAQGGKKTVEIAQLAGVSEERIRFVLSRHGITITRTPKEKKPGIVERKAAQKLRIEAVAKAWAEGKLGKEIAAIFHLSPATVAPMITRLRKKYPDLFPHRKGTETAAYHLRPVPSAPGSTA